MLTPGRYVRSVPRDERRRSAHAYWRGKDVDGDGLALAMRVRDPGGEMVESAEIPGPAAAADDRRPPPFYKVYPEGVIENFDGAERAVAVLPVRQPDRSQPQFPVLVGAGLQAGRRGRVSAERGRVARVVEFTTQHPEIFLWLNLHTFGGVFIRPLGDKPDTKMDQQDLALFRQLGAWAEEITGYPMVSGSEEFLYEPDTPLHGDLTDYAYHQRGAVAYVVELWDLFKQAGLERKKRFVDNYTHLTRADMLKIAAWDRDKNDGRSILPWRSSSIRSWAKSRSAASIRASACGIRRHRKCRRSARRRPRTSCARRRWRRRSSMDAVRPRRCDRTDPRDA